MSIREEIKSLSEVEFGDWLTEKGFHEDLVFSFVSQRISGKAFLLLSEDDVKELVPTIGDRTVVRDLLSKCKVHTHTHTHTFIDIFLVVNRRPGGGGG